SGELAIWADGTDQVRPGSFGESRTLSLQDVEVNFTKRRCLMHDAGAAVGRDEFGGHNAPGKVLLTAGLERAGDRAQRSVVIVERRHIAFAQELAAFNGAEHFELLLHLAGQR